MGTRHIIAVYQNGERKVSQYGHWDGYLEEAGLELLHFLRDPEKVSALKKHLPECRFKEGNTCHEYAMDTINMIAAGEGSELEEYWVPLKDSWLEFVYDVDFDLGYLSVYPNGYEGMAWSLQCLPTDKKFLEGFRKYFEDMYTEQGLDALNKEYGTDFKKQSREDLPLF